MGFQSPAMLWGLLLAALPIAIHLIQRRRARVLPFASIEFLLAGDARRARKLRIQQWLVLALRVALLAALALALAKPYIADESAPSVSSAEPSAVVLLLDNSASMAALDDQGERLFDGVLEAARERISEGGPLARFGLVTTSRPARALTPELTQDRSALLLALSQLKLTHRGADTSRGIEEAQRLLAGAVEEARVLWIGSDRAHHAWSGASRLSSSAPGPSTTWVEFATIDRSKGPRNLSIDAVSPAPGAGPSGETGFEVQVTNHGALTEKTEVRVRVGERVSAVSLEIPPGESATASLFIALEVDLAARQGVAEITTTDDSLDTDDRHFFDLSDARALRIAVVNGSPRNVPWLDEVFFVRAGLSARGDGAERWSPQHVQTTELTSGLLVHTDVLILANVGALADSQALAVRRFVQEGGGLLIAAGDQMSAESNLSYGGLLPVPIRTLKRRPKSPVNASGTDPARGLTLERREHPILRTFNADSAATLTRAKARLLALLNDQRRPGVEILARWSQGEPALVERPLGEGRVLFLTTSLDRDGSDLVLRTSFVPFLQRTVEYLAGRFDQERRQELRLGEVLMLEAPPGTGPVVLAGPQGLERELETRDVRPGQPAQVEIRPLDRAGSYSLSRRNDPLSARSFSLNVDPEESLLSSYGPEELRERLLGGGGDAELSSESVIEKGAGAAPLPAHGEPLWPLALLSLFGLLLGEAWFALRAG